MTRSAGRPRNSQLNIALIEAAEELILENGFSAASVEAIALRAGTTRPTFYRRFSGVPELILALLLKRFEIDLDQEIDFGNLPADLQAIQRDQLETFLSPLVQHSFAGFLDSLKSDSQLKAVFVERFLGPRRAGAAAIIRRAEGRGEIAPNPDVEWVCDLLTGPLFMRVLMPGLMPLDEALVANTVTSALCALGYTPTSST